MTRHVALLRGVNVGGHNRVSMTDLRGELERSGYTNVITYINSGNILLTTTIDSSIDAIATSVKSAVKRISSVDCEVVVMSSKALGKVIARAPVWWGLDTNWKHNMLFTIPPTAAADVIAAIGPLKSGLEEVVAGKGVVYQSMSFDKFGQTASGKLASTAAYKQITIRNFTTVHKLYKLAKTD